MSGAILYDALGQPLTSTRRIMTLERGEMQALVDSEVAWMSLGIIPWIHCNFCHKRLNSFNGEQTGIWGTECDCTSWQYVGKDIEPPQGDWHFAESRDLLPDEKRHEEPISRKVMSAINDFERVVVGKMRNPYGIDCYWCQVAGRPVGCGGSQKDESRSWIAECHCSIRTYRDAGSANVAERTH